MKVVLALLVSATIFFISVCKQKNRSGEASTKKKLRILFKVIPEDYNGGYSVSWDDTLGNAAGYSKKSINDRPGEIWCYIKDVKKDTVGYYASFSSAQTFAYFQTKDTIVNISFMEGTYMFGDGFENEVDILEYQKANHLPISYNEISINLKSDLYKQYNVELIAK